MSPSQVNIPESVRRSVGQNIKASQISVNTFSQARNEILKLMERDNFSRYRNLPEFRKALADIGVFPDALELCDKEEEQEAARMSSSSTPPHRDSEVSNQSSARESLPSPQPASSAATRRRSSLIPLPNSLMPAPNSSRRSSAIQQLGALVPLPISSPTTTSLRPSLTGPATAAGPSAPRRASRMSLQKTLEAQRRKSTEVTALRPLSEYYEEIFPTLNDLLSSPEGSTHSKAASPTC